MQPLHPRRLRAALPTVAMAAGALVHTACVVGSSRPPSRLEVARAPLVPTPRADPTVDTPAGCAAAQVEPRPPRPQGDVVWVDGDCHHDGIRHVWRQGRWEARGGAVPWR